MDSLGKAFLWPNKSFTVVFDGKIENMLRNRLPQHTYHHINPLLLFAYLCSESKYMHRSTFIQEIQTQMLFWKIQ